MSNVVTATEPTLLWKINWMNNRVKFGSSANEKSSMCLRIWNELTLGKLSSYEGAPFAHSDRMMLTHLTLISDLDNDTYALGSMPQSAEWKKQKQLWSSCGTELLIPWSMKNCHFSSNKMEVHAVTDDNSSSVADQKPCHLILPWRSTRYMYLQLNCWTTLYVLKKHLILVFLSKMSKGKGISCTQ
jgi:hypothetical protein